MGFGILWEFYASLSGLMPKPFYTTQQHQLTYYRKYTDDPYASLYDAAVEFYTENSGLTPAGSYSISDHVNAYFANILQYNAPWEAIIQADALAIVGGSGGPGTPNLFTATFGANF